MRSKKYIKESNYHARLNVAPRISSGREIPPFHAVSPSLDRVDSTLHIFLPCVGVRVTRCCVTPKVLTPESEL